MKPHIKRYKAMYGPFWGWSCSGDNRNAVAPTALEAYDFWLLMTNRPPRLPIPDSVRILA